MENNKTVFDIEREIKILSEEKKDIQSKCKHKSRYIKFVNGTSTLKQFCSECNKEIGYPSKDELDDFLSQK